RRLQALLGHMTEMNNMDESTTNREDGTVRPQEKMPQLLFEEFALGCHRTAVRHFLQGEKGINYRLEPLSRRVLRYFPGKMKIGSFKLCLRRWLDENFVLQAPRAILC